MSHLHCEHCGGHGVIVVHGITSICPVCVDNQVDADARQLEWQWSEFVSKTAPMMEQIFIEKLGGTMPAAEWYEYLGISKKYERWYRHERTKRLWSDFDKSVGKVKRKSKSEVCGVPTLDDFANHDQDAVA